LKIASITHGSILAFQLQDRFRHLYSVYFLILVIAYATSRADFRWQQLDSTAPQSSRACKWGEEMVLPFCAGQS